MTRCGRHTLPRAPQVSSELSGLDVPSSPSKTSPHASGPPSHGAARPHSATGLRHPLGSPFGVLHAQQQVEPHSPTARAPSCGPASAAGLTVDCLSRHDSNSNNAAAAAQLCGLPTSPSCSSQWGRDADEVLALSFFQRTSNPGTRPAAGVTSHPLDSRHSGLMSPTYSLSRCASPAVHSGSFVVHSGSHAHVPLVPEWLDRSVHIRRDGPHLTSSWVSAATRSHTSTLPACAARDRQSPLARLAVCQQLLLAPPASAAACPYATHTKCCGTQPCCNASMLVHAQPRMSSPLTGPVDKGED